MVSSAIPETNPELAEARRRGIPVWPRAKMLAHLAGERRDDRGRRHPRQDLDELDDRHDALAHGSRPDVPHRRRGRRVRHQRGERLGRALRGRGRRERRVVHPPRPAHRHRHQRRGRPSRPLRHARGGRSDLLRVHGARARRRHARHLRRRRPPRRAGEHHGPHAPSPTGSPRRATCAAARSEQSGVGDPLRRRGPGRQIVPSRSRARRAATWSPTPPRRSPPPGCSDSTWSRPPPRSPSSRACAAVSTWSARSPA